jgi:hypothetical protein
VLRRFGHYATGSINVTAGRPPYNGTLTVAPSNGTAFSTVYQVVTVGWQDDPTSYPLSYKFFYAISSDIGRTVFGVGSDGSAAYLNALNGSASVHSILPIGEGVDYNLTVGVTVSDVIEASATVSLVAYSLPPRHFHPRELHTTARSLVASAIADGSYISAATTLASVATVARYVLTTSSNATEVAGALSLRTQLLNLTSHLIASSATNGPAVETQAVAVELLSRSRPDALTADER